MDNEDQKIIDMLVLSGALQMAGINEKTGEILYQFTPKLKEVMPDLYHEHLNYVNSEIMGLWEKGFVNVDLMSDSPIVTITEKALIQDEINQLSKSDQWAIEEIKRILRVQEL
jgi:hypothetical protein